MRAIVVGAMVLGFAISPALARTGSGDKAGTTAAETSSASAANTTSSEPAAGSKSGAPAKPAESSMESELQELRDLIEAQSKQIQVQSEALKEQQQQMQTLENQLKISSPANASVSAAPVESASVAPSSSMALNALSPNAAAPNALAKAQKPADDEPQSLRFKGITLTPGGYMAAETVWRNRAIGSGINSDFKGLPLPGQSQSHLTEFNASGRQSRIAMLAQGKLKDVTIGGYYEMDFLSAGVTSNDNQSNSYTLR